MFVIKDTIEGHHLCRAVAMAQRYLMSLLALCIENSFVVVNSRQLILKAVHP